jgi:hypothetical protein
MKIPEPLSHAYLITGGSEKSRAAWADMMAAAYLCEGEQAPCGRCRHCRKAASGAHPDLIRISPLEGKREISVDQIRTLRTDAYIRPNEGAHKVYIFEDCTQLNARDQNILLKIVEEGPSYASFLFCTEFAETLLQTMRSRCTELRLPPPLQKEETSAQAQELYRCLYDGTTLSRASFFAEWESEKPTREAVGTVFAQLYALLAAARIRRTDTDSLNVTQQHALLALIARYREYCEYNVNVGILLGGFAAELEGIV